jgi:N-acetylglucosamine-6-phosphate deacetylase
MITENPAREVGVLDRKGRVEVGYDADLVLFDEDIQIQAVWRAGRKVR